MMNDLTQQAVHAPQAPQFIPPISGAPAAHVIEPQIPQVPIPHMGTSALTVPTPPEGVTQIAIDAAIRHVEQTGRTDGISPQILAAACQQIEAQAAAQGIDLTQPTAQPAPPSAPANYVEAAVMDKRGTFETFHNHRENLNAAVAEQRDAAKRTYADALSRSGETSGEHAAQQANTEAMKALVNELKALDPETIALINAMGVLSNTPEVLKSIIWMEIIRAMRNLISTEARQQVRACMNGDPSKT
ncbi:MAG: hypothetical protein NUV50_05795 [Rhodospirillales bacterium]|nr:hypothetical protein [Rhodospirillales bacterium]